MRFGENDASALRKTRDNKILQGSSDTDPIQQCACPLLWSTVSAQFVDKPICVCSVFAARRSDRTADGRCVRRTNSLPLQPLSQCRGHCLRVQFSLPSMPQTIVLFSLHCVHRFSERGRREKPFLTWRSLTPHSSLFCERPDECSACPQTRYFPP